MLPTPWAADSGANSGLDSGHQFTQGDHPVPPAAQFGQYDPERSGRPLSPRAAVVEDDHRAGSCMPQDEASRDGG